MTPLQPLAERPARAPTSQRGRSKLDTVNETEETVEPDCIDPMNGIGFGRFHSRKGEVETLSEYKTSIICQCREDDVFPWSRVQDPRLYLYGPFVTSHGLRHCTTLDCEERRSSRLKTPPPSEVPAPNPRTPHNRVQNNPSTRVPAAHVGGLTRR